MKKVVVISYEEGWVSPRVLLKGVGHIAQKILSVATENKVPIVSNENLVRSLWATSDGDFIKEDLFEMVADILSFVYSLDEERGTIN